MDEPESRLARFAAIAHTLETLASPTRLEIIHLLRTPKRIGEIRVSASRTREGEQPDRPLARQTVAHHVENLLAAGILKSVIVADEKDAVVLDHAKLFALVDEVRALAKLRPLDVGPSADATMGRSAAVRARLPEPPRLVVAFGQEDGLGHSLAGPMGRSWRIGRGTSCDIALDYDPFASTESARIERTGEGFMLHDLGARNGTWHNWERLPPNGVAKLAPGSIVGVGRSVFVLQC